MLDEAVLIMFEGRSKKVKCLFKKQALSVTTWLSENEGEWEEAQIYSFMSNSWGRSGLDKGNITNFVAVLKMQMVNLFSMLKAADLARFSF